MIQDLISNQVQNMKIWFTCLGLYITYINPKTMDAEVLGRGNPFHNLDSSDDDNNDKKNGFKFGSLDELQFTSASDVDIVEKFNYLPEDMVEYIHSINPKDAIVLNGKEKNFNVFFFFKKDILS